MHPLLRKGPGTTSNEGLGKNYEVILDEGHVHREMLKTFAYFAKD